MENQDISTTSRHQPFKLLTQRQFPLVNLSPSLVEKGSLFQYNTSIVDLNPFEKRDNRSTGLLDSRFRSSDNNTLMLNKIMNQKKFLVNKNIRFYEPIKDAEILANFDSLRSKLLVTAHTIDGSPPTLHLIHDENLPKKNDEDYYVMSKNKELSDSYENFNIVSYFYR